MSTIKVVKETGCAACAGNGHVASASRVGTNYYGVTMPCPSCHGTGSTVEELPGWRAILETEYEELADKAWRYDENST